MRKEVQHDALVTSQQERVDAAMVREWDKWNEFVVTKFLSKKQVNDIMKRTQDHSQGSTGRSRVSRRQGLHQYRNTHWMARRLLHDTLSSSSKRLGLTACSMLSQRTSSQTASRDHCCCGCLTKIRQSVCCYWFDLRDEHSKKVLEAAGLAESRLEQSLYCLHDHLDQRLSCTRMSTTFCLGSIKPPRNTRMFCNILCASFI